MKKSILLVGSLLVCLFLLVGCSCKHQWADATCLTPKTCTLCEEFEGEPAGHKWVEANCELPKTCMVCSATEGQPLAHSEAVRDCAINYKTLTREQQTYCKNCDQVLSSEEITLDTLHDGTHFLIDGKGFLERFTVLEEPFKLMPISSDADFTVVEMKEETAKDVLVLERSDNYGYKIRTSFTFCELEKGSDEHAVPRCRRIVVNPAVSGDLGDPDPEGWLDSAQPNELDAANSLRNAANAVAINDLMFSNLMIGYMVLDPSMETDGPNMEEWLVLLDILDVVHGEKPSVIMNGIQYYSNENGELVIEVAA